MTSAAPLAQPHSVDEAECWRALRRDGEASVRELLFNRYYAFATRIARKHFLDRRSGDIELGDLSQLAAAGLLEAINSFDPDRGIPFEGYARRRITGSILDGVSKMSEFREQISFRNRIRRERTRSLAGEGNLLGSGADDSLKALAEIAVGLALGFMLDDTNLYQSEERSERAPNAYDSLVWKETMTAAVNCVAELPPRERAIIEHHYMRGLAFDQLTSVMNLSKGRISQLHRSALALLRQRLSAARHFSLER